VERSSVKVESQEPRGADGEFYRLRLRRRRSFDLEMVRGLTYTEKTEKIADCQVVGRWIEEKVQYVEKF
jgi:hypothetical protein